MCPFRTRVIRPCGSRLAALAILAVVAGGCATAHPPESVTGPHFSVLTYNVNFGGPGPGETVAAIAAADADVVCLQETTPEWEMAVRAGVGERYPAIRFLHAPGGAGGTGLLSKWPVRQIQFYRPTAGWFPACLATVETPAGVVQFVSVHLRPPVSEGGSFVSGYFSTPPVRRSEVEELYAYAAGAEPGVPRVFVGDFNESASGSAVRFLRSRGLRHPLSHFDPHTSTWRWQLGVIPLRGRLDHVLHDPSLHCFDARVLRRGASDHFPILARFGPARSL